MVRFYVFGGAQVSGDKPKLNATYAFCLDERPDRIYWGVGTLGDSAAVIRKGVERILDAFMELDYSKEIQIITSQNGFGERVNFIVDRKIEKDRGREREIDPGWLSFALDYKQSQVMYRSINQMGDMNLLRAVKREAHRQRRNAWAIQQPDAQFAHRDSHNLADDLREVLAANIRTR